MMKIPKSKFTIFKYLFLLLFILFQVYLIFIRKHYALDIDASPGTNPSINIYQDLKIGQTFVSKRNNLARIDVAMGTHRRTNTKDVIFQLWEFSPKRELIVEKTFNASTVKDNLLFPLDFKPIKKSKGKTYYFAFSSPESTFENSVCTWMNKKNIYREGSFYLGNSRRRGDLVFRVYSRRPVFTELGRVVRNYSGLFASKTLLIVVIVLFEIVQVVFLSKLLDMIRQTFKEQETG